MIAGFILCEFLILILYGLLLADANKRKNSGRFRGDEGFVSLTSSEKLKILFRAHIYFFAFIAAYYLFMVVLHFVFSSGGNYQDGPDPNWGGRF